MTRVVAMQPTYLPWIGYFALIDLADVFVFLDDVQFDRRSWQQRNKIKGPNGEILLTVPVRKAPRDTPINEIEVNYEQDFPANHLANLKHNYRPASHFDRYWSVLSSDLRAAPVRLVDLNVQLIASLADEIGFTSRFVRSSALFANGYKDGYLASICQELSASEYLSPIGSRAYLEHSSEFADRGIDVRYLEFEHPSYPQLHGAFLSHLSVVDLLMNVGEGSAELIRVGYGRGAPS